MATIKVQAFVYLQEVHDYDPATQTYKSRVSATAFPYDNASCVGALVGPCEFSYTLPAGFDIKSEMIRQELARIESEELAALNEYQKKSAALRDRKAKLQAITNEVTA